MEINTANGQKFRDLSHTLHFAMETDLEDKISLQALQSP